MHIPACPACGNSMRATPARNSASRYARGVYICSPCGVREAFVGDIMSLSDGMHAAILAEQKPWLTGE
jgi:hypothetical protein